MAFEDVKITFIVALRKGEKKKQLKKCRASWLRVVVGVLVRQMKAIR